MSEEAKKAIESICEKIAKGKVMQAAVEIAVELHEAGAVAEAMESIREEEQS